MMQLVPFLPTHLTSRINQTLQLAGSLLPPNRIQKIRVHVVFLRVRPGQLMEIDGGKPRKA